MALPIGPYQGQDLTNYEAGNKFLPREFYSLNSTLPSPIQANTIGNSGGITGTQATGSYMGYPSYEAWLLAQGGGGGNGGGQDDSITNTYNVNQNLGPTNITDYEAEAYDVGPTWAGTWARAKDLYSRLPTPGNLLMRGIRKWRENREIKKEQQRIAEDRTGIGEHDRGTFTGDHPDAPTKTPEQGGWHPGVGGGSQPHGTDTSGDFAGKGSSNPFGRAQGGRIGYNRGRVVNPGGYNGVIDRNIANLKAALEYSELSAEERAQLEADLQMSIEAKGGWEDQLLSGDPVSKAQGGLIGYFDGGIARLL